jgi:pimeloyl-ACP methyl ester carboxylesterase
MAKRANFWLGVTLLGLALTLVVLGGLAINDAAVSNGQPLTFREPGGDQLAATYYPGARPIGVLLLAGFGSDQAMLRSAAVEFAALGAHLFTFDYSGHGYSPGMLRFDNARTDRLAQQVLAAKEEFKRLSGLRDDQIIILGHSAGARAGLQAATLDRQPVAGLILLGASVNLTQNKQAEFFSGTSDADLEWIQQLGPDNPPVPLILISGVWDDILTPEAARLLIDQLGGPAPEREFRLLDNLFHNYEIYAPDALSPAKVWAAERWGIPTVSSTPSAEWRIVGWFVGLLGLFTTVIGARRWVQLRWPAPPAEFRVTLVNTRRFWLGKLLLWLAAVPLTLVLFAVFIWLPLGLPIFNLIYVGFIGAYGLVLYGLYRAGKLPGTRGRLPFVAPSARPTTPQTLAALGLAAIALALSAAFIRTGLNAVPVQGDRLIWLIIFTPLTALGFWIGLYEMQLTPDRWWAKTTTGLIGLTPFFVLALLYAALGSISGFLSSVQGLIILAFALSVGALVQAVGRRSWLTAVVQAVVLYWLILPQSALFVRPF